MKQPLSIKDLINLLYQHKEVVEMLFGNKDSINKSELLAREDMTDEKLEKLVAYEIIYENNNIISLDDRITTFIEEFLEIGEVTTSFINDNIQTLSESLKYYHIDNNPKFLRNIKKSLKKINSTTSREVIKLHKNIDDTYKNQGNYYIKLQELEKYKRKRDDIINLIMESERIIGEAQGFFNTIVDAEISSIVLDLRYTLVRNRDYLNEIQAQIIDYINRMQHQAEIYKKIQRLKELKDYEELKYKTNFVDVVMGIRSLVFNRKAPLKTRLSLDFLHTDHGYSLTQKVAHKLHLLRNTDRKPAGKLSDDFYETFKEESSRLNIGSLVEKFMQSGQDLFGFIQDYQFPEKIGEFGMEKRISLYVGISIDFDAQVNITDSFSHMEFINERGLKQKVGYALIYPGEQKGELKAEGLKLKVESEEVEKLRAEGLKHKADEVPEVKSEEQKAESEKLKAKGPKLKAKSEKPKAEVSKSKAKVKGEKLKAKSSELKAGNEKLKAKSPKKKSEGKKNNVAIEEQSDAESEKLAG